MDRKYVIKNLLHEHHNIIETLKTYELKGKRTRR
jgi:hypothetical protein